MQKNFVQFSWITIGAVYLLILVGGIVRSTGSGMGCPDWPKCFGRLVPPTHVSELPENYKEIYAQKRKEKNLRLVGFLKVIGMHQAAERVQKDESIYIEEDFNVQKTWIEYLNRLLGVLVGLLILVTFFASLSYLKNQPTITFLAFFAFVLVVFQGWIGSIVVSTNLLEGMVTLHMFLAIIQVLLMTYNVHLAQNTRKTISYFPNNTVSSSTKILLLITIVLSLGQVLLGTQVREQIDSIAREIATRSQWIEKLDYRFYIHRSYSLVLLGLSVFLLYRLKKEKTFNYIKTPYLLLLATIGIAIVTGATMAYFSVPAFLQPLHLILAVIMMGLEWQIWLRIKNSLFLNK